MCRFFRQLWQEISTEMRTFGFWCQTFTYIITLILLTYILPTYIDVWLQSLNEEEKKKGQPFFKGLSVVCYVFACVLLAMILGNISNMIWIILRPRFFGRDMHVHWSPVFESQEVIQMEPLPPIAPPADMYFPAFDAERPEVDPMEGNSDDFPTSLFASRKAVSSPDIYSDT